jgi:hypothetical protein
LHAISLYINFPATKETLYRVWAMAAQPAFQTVAESGQPAAAEELAALLKEAATLLTAVWSFLTAYRESSPRVYLPWPVEWA